MRIVDVCKNVCSGGTPNKKHNEYYENGSIPWLNTSEVNFGRIRKTEKYISQIGLEHSSAKWVPQNTVVVAMYGATAGKTAITKIPLTTNQACCNLVVDENKADYRYVFYYLKNMYSHLSSLANGGAQQNLNAGQIKDYPFAWRELSEQKKIADILSILDDKIETNEKINNNLEQQAQAIFKEWFIDNPANSEWKVGTFSELVKSTLSGDWGKETPTGNNTEKVYCVRGADIPDVRAGNKGKMPIRYILPKNYANKKLEAGDIVVEISDGSPTQSTGRCTAITQSLLDRYDSGMVCTNFCKAIKPIDGYSLFIYYYWLYLYDKGVFFSYENGTTGIKNLDFLGFLETESILIPPVDKVAAFDEYCQTIFAEVFSNGKQNEQLAILRDTLLPKLMSGELDVATVNL